MEHVKNGRVIPTKEEIRDRVLHLERQLDAARKCLALLERNPDIEEAIQLVYQVRGLL